MLVARHSYWCKTWCANGVLWGQKVYLYKSWLELKIYAMLWLMEETPKRCYYSRVLVTLEKYVQIKFVVVVMVVVVDHKIESLFTNSCQTTQTLLHNQPRPIWEYVFLLQYGNNIVTNSILLLQYIEVGSSFVDDGKRLW